MFIVKFFLIRFLRNDDIILYLLFGFGCRVWGIVLEFMVGILFL